MSTRPANHSAVSQSRDISPPITAPCWGHVAAMTQLLLVTWLVVVLARLEFPHGLLEIGQGMECCALIGWCSVTWWNAAPPLADITRYNCINWQGSPCDTVFQGFYIAETSAAALFTKLHKFIISSTWRCRKTQILHWKCLNCWGVGMHSRRTGLSTMEWIALFA